ncbi:hypothetical protein Nmel_011684 [Mimus melanotis]
MSKETKKPFRQSMAEWRQFIYNPNSGEFLGRTAKSWGKGCRGEQGWGKTPAKPRGGEERGRAREVVGGGMREGPPRG